MTEPRRPVVGSAASSAVSAGLVLILIFAYQQNSDGRETPENDPATIKPPVSEKADTPASLPIVLPPPPSAPASAALKPRAVRDQTAAAPSHPPLKPLTPRATLAAPPPPDVKPLAPRRKVAALKPMPVQARAVVSPAKPVEARKQTSPPAPSALEAPASETLAPSVDIQTEGRVLLRLLESGNGPRIKIAWPASASAREALYRRLTQCHGMRTAILSKDKKIFLNEGPAGIANSMNLDRSSGFVRHPDGALPTGERSVAKDIRSRHRLSGGTTIRVFPRAVDAALLGGLSSEIGSGYLKRGEITARYRIVDGRVSIGDVTADGQRFRTEIFLPPLSSGCVG